jgi:serine/threonine protein kinase
VKRGAGGRTFESGIWRLGKRIGEGGNATVYRATRAKDSRGYAFKVLKSRHGGKPYEPRDIVRFQTEAKALSRCNDIPGVLPLVDEHFPELPTATTPPWIVLGLARRFDEALGPHPSLVRVVEASAEIAETLALMHERDVSHRDIKPANLFHYNGRWCVGDFGLARIGDHILLTQPGELVGPMMYIAPEMLNLAAQSNGKSADVFSLAKTLWRCGTGQRYPLQGEFYRTHPGYCLSTYVNNDRAILLDPILEMCTRLEPERRLSMAEFASELRAWLNPPAPRSSSDADLSDLADRLRLLNQPHLVRQQQAAERQSYRHANCTRIRDRMAPWAQDMMLRLKTVGFDTELQIGNVNYGFYLNAHAATVELQASATITFEDDGHAIVTAQFLQPNKHPAEIFWQQSREFLAGTSRERSELEGLGVEMINQVRPVVESLLAASGTNM